jgi:hypothetical protein
MNIEKLTKRLAENSEEDKIEYVDIIELGSFLETKADEYEAGSEGSYTDSSDSDEDFVSEMNDEVEPVELKLPRLSETYSNPVQEIIREYVQLWLIKTE